MQGFAADVAERKLKERAGEDGHLLRPNPMAGIRSKSPRRGGNAPDLESGKYDGLNYQAIQGRIEWIKQPPPPPPDELEAGGVMLLLGGFALV